MSEIADCLLAERQNTASNRTAPPARKAGSPSLRLTFDFKITSCDRDNMQEQRRLEPVERASPVAEQEAWAAQTGYHQDGAGCYGVH